jgi:branched-chain amino acid transport system permease protein
VITNNVLRNWEAIGPGARTLSLVPETTDFVQGTIGVIAVAVLAFAYQRSRFGRVLRASREDAFAAQGSGVDMYRQRLLAFTLSGALAGFAGGLLVHLLGSFTTQQVYLDLAFLTLAMLVIGGVRSLWGAVVGALLVSGVNSLLLSAERGLNLGLGEVTVPTGTRLVTLGVVMALILLFRPRGVTGGREVSLPWPR